MAFALYDLGRSEQEVDPFSVELGELVAHLIDLD